MSLFSKTLPISNLPAKPEQRAIERMRFAGSGKFAQRCRVLFSAAFCVAAASLAAGCVSTNEGNITAQTVIAPVAVDEAHALTKLNDYRAQHGLAPLQLDPELNKAATKMALLIAHKDSMDTWAHSAFGLAHRLDSAGYANWAAAENLGSGYASYDAAFAGWQGSPHHNQNLLNPYVTRVGIAHVDRSDGKWRHFWVMELARPYSAGQPTLVKPNKH